MVCLTFKGTNIVAPKHGERTWKAFAKKLKAGDCFFHANEQTVTQTLRKYGINPKDLRQIPMITGSIFYYEPKDKGQQNGQIHSGDRRQEI